MKKAIILVVHALDKSINQIVTKSTYIGPLQSDIQA